MFFDTVEELHSKFKIFDQINTIVFGIWKDKSALEYRDGALQDLRILYINYINEMRQQCNELEQLNREVAGVLGEVQNGLTKIEVIASSPSIQGCAVGLATGYTDYHKTTDGKIIYDNLTTKYFVMGPQEISRLQEVGEERTGLYECKCSFFRNL